jgi:opacity protein-like surface antigen
MFLSRFLYKLLPGSRLAIALGLISIWSDAEPVEIPAGTVIELRLTHSLASFSSREGTDVQAVTVAPVRQGELILIPMGARVDGTVRDVRRIGWGLIHETARLQIEFTKLTLPDGSALDLRTRVTEVDNARESVDDEGRIKGIRATGTFGFRANNLIAGFAAVDPIAYIYVNVAAARMLRFTEPEIWLPAGTELMVKLSEPLQVSKSSLPPLPVIAATASDKAGLEGLVRSLPFRTVTEGSNKPSDFTNLVFLGPPAGLQRAFRAAGWVEADRLSTISGFMTMRSIAESQGYQAAPMSTLLLDERRPDSTLSKTLNTFSKRHHTRIWYLPETWNGMSVLTASSTQDIGISISRKQRMFIHVIDTFIDNERAKIVNDLVFTGCVDAAELVARPWLPKKAQNATGEPLITDSRIAVLRINACTDPQHAMDLEAKPDIPATDPAGERGVRQTALTIRNDVYRGNLIYQGYEGVSFGIRHLKAKPEKAPEPVRTTGIQGDRNTSAVADTNAINEHAAASQVRPVPLSELPPPPRSESDKWRPPHYEIGLQGGWLGYASNTLDLTRLVLQPKTPDLPFVDITLQNRLHNGWSAGTSLTLNTFRYFSSEFAFTYQHGKYRLGALAVAGIPGEEQGGYEEETTGLLSRQFQYNLIANLRPREKRFRPYIAAGPVLQMIHITDAPFKSSGGVFRVGLRNVGLLVAAYNFGTTAPLDGGGIFQFAFQYGGGVKYRVTPHWMVRFDVRETLGPQPDFIGRSFHVDEPTDSDPYLVHVTRLRPTGPLRQQRATLGFSFTF